MKIEPAILFIHKDHPLDLNGVNSGAEMATLSLAREFANQGRRVILAAIVKENTSAHLDGIEVWDLGPDFNVTKILQKAKSIGSYYLLSAGRAQAILESREEKNCLKRILISHDRSGNDTGINPTVLCRVADAIVCVSNAQKNVFIKAGANSEKCHTLYNGVDLTLFQSTEPNSRNFMQLLFVGALIEDKGIHWLLQSYCDLKAKYPQLSLEVYGSASLWGRPPMFDEADFARRIPDLHFHGKCPQSEIAKAYGKAGLCVIPSIWFDPFPLTALEAQACGCPVAVFDVGGLSEGVIEGETGIVMREIKPEILTASIEKLISNPATLRAMSSNALAKSRPRFTWDKVANDVLALCGEKPKELQHSFQDLTAQGKVEDLW